MADRPFEPIRDGTDRSRSRVGDADENGSYVQTEVFTSEHDEDALVEAHGNVLPPATSTGAVILSPTSPAFVPSSTYNDSRQVINQTANFHDQRMINVNLDKSAEVAQLAEARHRELMSKKDEEVKKTVEAIHREAHDHVKEQLELQERRAASWAANEQAKMNAHEAVIKNAALTEAQLYNHNLTELQQQAQSRESQLREELRTQTELIRELREKMETSARGNYEPAGTPANLRTTLPGPMGSNELPLGQPYRPMQKSMTDSSGEPYRDALASGAVNAPKVAGGGPPDHPSSSSSSSSDDKKKSKKDKKKKKKDDKEEKRGRSPRKKNKKKNKKGSPSPSESPSSSSSSSEDSSFARKVRKHLKKMKKEDREQRAKEAEKILIPKFPTPERYRDWRIKVRDNVSAASAKPDKARLWLGKVYEDAVTTKDLDDSEGFITLDAKLLSSLTNCAEGDLARQLNTFKETKEKAKEPIKGRQILLLFHEYFATSIKHGAIYDVEDLICVKMVNEDLKGFVTRWESVIAGMRTEVDKKWLEAYFHLAVRNFKPLAHDLAIYERASEGSAEKTYDFLIKSAKAYLERKRLEKMRDATKRSLGGKDPAAPVIDPSDKKPKGVCYEFQNKGKCSRRDCPFKHEKPRESSKGRPKGGGKGRSSSSRGRSLTPGSRSEVCKFWKSGDCHRGKNCAFKHPDRSSTPAPSDDRKKRKKKKKEKREKKKRSTSRGSNGSGGSQKSKGGKGASSNPAAVCLLRTLVLATAVSSSQSATIRCPLESVAMVATPATSSSPSSSSGRGKVKRLSFADKPEVFKHVVHCNSLMFPVVARKQRKHVSFPIGHKGNAEVLEMASEDACIAADRLSRAVSNELNGIEARCCYLCDSEMGCKHCFKNQRVTMPATEIAWIADTGSANDLVSREMVNRNEVFESSKPVSLLTANGVFQANDQANLDIPLLGITAKPYVLDDSPAVISVGQLCIDHDWSFIWPSNDTPYFKKPNGQRIKLQVKDYVPYLPSTSGMAMTAIGHKYEERASGNGKSSYIPIPTSPSVEEAPHESAETEPEAVDARLVPDPPGEKRDRGEQALRREAKSLVHLLTHVPKNPFCTTCSRAKMTKPPSYKKGGSETVDADKFGDHITADHLILRDDEEEAIDGSRNALVVKDIATDFRCVYPSARKTTRDCVLALKHFTRGRDDIGVFYSDNAEELVKAASELKWRHVTSVPYISKSNAQAERSIRSVLDGTRINLEQAGLHHTYWTHAARHCCMAHNILGDQESQTPWQLRFDEKFKGPMIPFGVRIDYWTGPKTKTKEKLKFDPTSLPGVFLGYKIHPEFSWRKEFLVLPLKEVMDNNFDSCVPWVGTNKLALPDGDFVFPLKDRYNAIREGRIPCYMISDDPPKPEDEDAKPVEELIDKGPMESGKALKVPSTDGMVDHSKKDAFESGIYDPGEDEEGKGGSSSSSSGKPKDPPKDPFEGVPPEDMVEVVDPVTGEVTSIPKEGSSFYSAGGYKTRKYKGTSKPPDVPSFLWKAASKAAREKEIRRYELEEARKKFKAAAAKVNNLNTNGSSSPRDRVDQNDDVPAMPVKEVIKHDHRDRLATAHELVKDMILNALVARPVGPKEVGENPAAQASLDLEWNKLESKPAWWYNTVQEWEHVASEARRTGEKVHVGKIFELCVEKGSELEKGNPLRKFKGRTVFQGNNVKDESSETALFAELGSSPANMEAAKALDCYGSAPGNRISQGDGKQAYTQTTLKGPETWIRIPRNRWPKEWVGKYKDPVIRLVLALYGHPDSGGFWERHCESCLIKVGFKALHPECWPSMFWHERLRLLLAVYVDDFKLAGPRENHDEGWKLIGEHIEMDPPEDVGRYLGCEHIVQHEVKLPVERHPFAHVFDHSIQDPSNTIMFNLESDLMFGRLTL